MGNVDDKDRSCPSRASRLNAVVRAQHSPKALCLLSGGLDSTLAARIVLDLRVELEAVNFVTAFCTCTPKTAGCAAAVSSARQLGIRVRSFDATEELLAVVRDPPHGYGTNLNPCIDCRILMFRRALEHMREIGARFLVTGEGLGERPMSQRRDSMRTIEREAGAEGLVLRPLSARLLEPSIPEREGWVDRDRMLSISGRSRKPQISLAREFGINDYPCPAGGCRLTDPGFAGRMRDLLDYEADLDVRSVRLLRWGRHFRLTPACKVILGRNEEENGRLSALAKPEDTIAVPSTVPGPTALVVGEFSGGEVELACAIAAAHMSRHEGAVAFDVRGGGSDPRTACAEALPRYRVEGMRIGPLPRGWRRALATTSGTAAADATRLKTGTPPRSGPSAASRSR
jgi:hypothetical protein